LKKPKGQSDPYIEEEQTTQWPKEKGQTTINKIHDRINLYGTSYLIPVRMTGLTEG
jgi:hypothetical protein